MYTANSEIAALKESIIRKSIISVELCNQSKSVEVAIGKEWSHDDFFKGISLREVDFQTDVDESLIVSVKAQKNSKCEPHYHTSSETLMVAQGEVYCPINNKRLKAGDKWKIPAGTIHSLEFIEDTMLVQMYHPRFEKQ